MHHDMRQRCRPRGQTEDHLKLIERLTEAKRNTAGTRCRRQPKPLDYCLECLANRVVWRSGRRVVGLGCIGHKDGAAADEQGGVLRNLCGSEASEAARE